MRGKGFWRCFRQIAGVLALGVVPLLVAEDQPDWKLVVAESNQVATFEGVKLHAKEGNAWLLTCRMRVSSSKAVPPLSQIEFRGLDADGETVWKKSHTIRSRDFEGAFGGGASQFVRVFIRDVPGSVTEVQLRYGAEEDPE